MDAGLAVDGSDEPHCKGGGLHKERRPVVQEQVEGERDSEGKNDERLANYFETGVTFALFQKDLWKIR
eukprot:4764811-Amphidinium_carterae.1